MCRVLRLTKAAGRERGGSYSGQRSVRGHCRIQGSRLAAAHLALFSKFRTDPGPAVTAVDSLFVYSAETASIKYLQLSQQRSDPTHAPPRTQRRTGGDFFELQKRESQRTNTGTGTGTVLISKTDIYYLLKFLSADMQTYLLTGDVNDDQ